MAAPYRDIYSYLISDTPQNIGDVASTGGGDDPRGGSGPLQFGTGTWQGDKYQVPDKYKGLIDVTHMAGGGDDPKGSSSIDINFAKLPGGGMTKFGRVDRTIPAEDPNTPVGKGQSSSIKDRNLVYNDPNYGWITPASNRKITGMDKFSAIEPLIAMALGSAGFGALASIPLLAQGAVAGGKFLGGKAGPGTAGGAPQQTPTSGPQAIRGGMSQFPHLRNMIMNRG